MAEQMQVELSLGLQGNSKRFNDDGFSQTRSKTGYERDETLNFLTDNITFIDAEGMCGHYCLSSNGETDLLLPSSGSEANYPIPEDSPDWTLEEFSGTSKGEACSSANSQSHSVIPVTVDIIKTSLRTEHDAVRSSNQKPTSGEHKAAENVGPKNKTMEGKKLEALKTQTIPAAFPVMKRQGIQGDAENRPYKCTHCSWAFKKSSNLLSHMDTHSGLKPHVCELCGKAYSHQGTLQQHKRLHTGERPYRCPFCDRTYIWSSDYRKHIRTHTGEKPYVCKSCGKDFVRSSDLRKHERNIHTNNKPFPCQQCGKTFNKPLSLLRHQRTHLGEKPFTCPDCGKDFAVASRMVEHQKTHRGVRPYVCPVCFKAFTKSSNLLEHQSLHSGLRPHKCSECGVAFAMASRLVRHQRVHTGERPFGCSDCGRAFSRSSTLKRHQELHSNQDLVVHQE